jgi:sRNA-binding protein
MKTNRLALKFDTKNSISKEIQILQTKTATMHSFAKPTPKAKTVYSPEVKEFFEILAILNKKNPKVFPLKGPRPSLKKGITHDIIDELDQPKKKIKSFMAWYTCSRLYLQDHKAGVPRFDLNGQVVDYVTQSDAQAKMEILNRVHAHKHS